MSVRDYSGKEVIVSYEVKRCIHAAECVGGAPEVFNPNAKPWIQPDQAGADKIAAVVHRCPSGALTLRYADGRSAETPDSSNTVTLNANGPLYVRGRIITADGAGAESLREYTRVALCRCGASANKPFCDGSHTKIGFTDAGVLAAPAKPLPAAEPQQPTGRIKLNPTVNGPMMIEGWFEFVGADGNKKISGDKCWLCRCGHSANKPFCDGTHKKAGFVG